MKKHIFLLFFLTFSILGIGQTPPKFTIAILGDKKIPETDVVVQQLKDEIISVVGQEAEITFHDRYILLNDLDPEKAGENYRFVSEAKEVDLILSFGSINNFVIGKNKQFPKPVILFGVINDDFISFPLGQTKSNISNLTYILTPQSYKRDLLLFKEIFSFKKIGVVLDQYLTRIYPVKETLDELFEEIETDYVLIPIDKLSDLDGKLDSIDAVFLYGGIYFTKEEQSALIEKINEKKLPSFSSTEKLLSDTGVLISSIPINNQKQFFRRIALNIEAVVNGENLSDLPVFLDVESKLFLNIETAFQIDFPIRYSFLVQTNLIGDANNITYQKKYELVDVMKQLLNENLSLKVEKKNIDLANQEVKLATSEYFPELTSSVTGSYIDPDLAEVSNGSNPEYSTSGNIKLEQLIFSEQASGNIQIQKKLKQASEESFNAIEKDALLEVGTSYYYALIAKADFLINYENLRVTRKNIEIAQQNYSAGQTGKSDVLRWKSELARSTQDVVSTLTYLQQAYHELNRLLNNPIELRIDVVDPNSDDSNPYELNYKELLKLIDDPILRDRFVTHLKDVAVQNAHELKSLQFNIKATERSEQLFQRSKFLPTVALQGQYDHTFTKDGKGSSYPAGVSGAPDGYYNVALLLSLPIFQKNQRNINRQKSFIEKEQLSIQKEQVEINIRKNIDDIILDIINQIANIELSKISTETSKESLELMQISYANGAIGITSLIDAQQAYFQAQQLQANASFNFRLSILQLERILSYFFLLHTITENQTFVQGIKENLLNTK